MKDFLIQEIKILVYGDDIVHTLGDLDDTTITKTPEFPFSSLLRGQQK